MNRWRFQFKLSFLLSIAIAVSVVAAFFTSPSLFTLTALIIGCTGVMLVNIPKYRKIPTLVGGAVGFATATVLVLFMVMYAVIESPVYQGQLYHEDGPAAFFMVVFVVWFVGSFVAAWFGMLVGCVIGVFADLVNSANFDADQNRFSK